MCFFGTEILGNQKVGVSNTPPKKKNYFTSSDPHHDMLGEGCQVNVIYHVKQAFQNVQTRHTCFLECCAILSHPARYSV